MREVSGPPIEVQMSLQDALKEKTLALISEQMNNWVVDIQRHVGRHQGDLVRALDELSETVARFDEKIDEGFIARSIAEVLAAQPPPGPAFDRLKTSLTAIEKGTSLSEVLTYLVNEVAQFVPRVAMFIVKGPSAIGWYAKGFEPGDAIKQLSVPLGSDTLFRTVHGSRQALQTALGETPGTQQVLGRLAAGAQTALAVPLILRDKLAAILYCDTPNDRIPASAADLAEILVLFAGKIVDVLSAAPKPATAPAKATTAGSTVERAQAIRSGGEEVRERAGVPTPAPSRPPAPTPPPAVTDEGASTVMFNPGAMNAVRAQMPNAAPAPPRPAAAAPTPSPAGGLPPEQQKAHEDAKRFARLVVSEIKLYNESKVTEGRRQKDLYERLKEDIERGRQMYTERVASAIRESTNYFFDELVRILAGGDASALGPM
jgi:hypothetical protein